jgi:hypothetical protein
MILSAAKICKQQIFETASCEKIETFKHIEEVIEQYL